MSKTLSQLFRPFVPNLSFRIQHVERETTLEVRFREHLGLVARGTRSYETRYVDVLRSLVRPGDRLFDVGANIGFYSVLFSRWVGESGSVIAYEPDQSNVALLRRNLKFNRCENTEVREIALSNNSGVDLFSLDTVTRSTGHLGTGPTYGETAFGRAKETSVSVTTGTVDEETKLWGPPNVLKLDIEGGEYDLLCGSTQVLDLHEPMVVSELSAWNDAGSSGRPKASLASELLCDHGYLLWDLDTGSRVRSGDVVWMVLGVPGRRLAEGPIREVLTKLENSPLR
jgi:FkbM family methyltransferase